MKYLMLGMFWVNFNLGLEKNFNDTDSLREITANSSSMLNDLLHKLKQDRDLTMALYRQAKESDEPDADKINKLCKDCEALDERIESVGKFVTHKDSFDDK